MSDTYLSGDTRQRIRFFIKNRKITQSVLPEGDAVDFSKPNAKDLTAAVMKAIAEAGIPEENSDKHKAPADINVPHRGTP